MTDLPSTVNLNKCIAQVFGPPLANDAEAKAAMWEIDNLLGTIKELRERQERSEKTIIDIRDMLVKGYKSNPWAYIRAACKKHFSLDITT